MAEREKENSRLPDHVKLYSSIFKAIGNYCIALHSLDGNLENSIIDLYPNPAASTFIVKSTFPDRRFTMRIYNLQGQMVHYEALDGKGEYEFTLSLASGIYIVVLSDGNKSLRKKLVVE